MPLPSHPISIALLPRDWLAIQAALRCAETQNMNLATTLRDRRKAEAAEEAARSIRAFHTTIGAFLRECEDAATERFLNDSSPPQSLQS